MNQEDDMDFGQLLIGLRDGIAAFIDSLEDDAEKRNRGCEYCREGREIQVEINYCPMCGRKLQEL